MVTSTPYNANTGRLLMVMMYILNFFKYKYLRGPGEGKK